MKKSNGHASRHPDPPDDEGVEPEPEAAGPPDPAHEARELEKLRRSLDEERERSLRLRADFENYRRRIARENGAEHAKGRRESLLPLLTVVDSFEHALEHGSSDQVFYAGVGAIHKQLLQALREAGAAPMESVGATFDPRLHEIVATERAKGADAQTIVREVRRGWRLGGDLLRPAQVVVAMPEDEG